MTQEDKELLIRDLCARVPYSVKIHVAGDWFYDEREPYDTTLDYNILNTFDRQNYGDRSLIIKPYLRPMSSMTEEEFKELTTVTELQYDQLELMDWGNNKTLEFYLSEVPQYCVIKVFDWLNAYHFDYHGLIERGLALEAPTGMY